MRREPVTQNDVDAFSLQEPPAAGFDCGREEQTRFLYKWAWADQQALLSVTYGYYLDGVLAAYSTVCMDALPLGKNERNPEVHYPEVGAMKLAQLGVATPFQGRGLGKLVIADMVTLARWVRMHVGCRYVALDAQPDLVGWYEAQGFKHSRFRQGQRVLDALRYGREPGKIAVSMRFDLRDPAMEEQ